MASGFEEKLQAAVASGAVPGAVALLVDRNGVTFETAAGVRSLGEPAAMTPDTVFWIASMTKAVTSVAALKMVEEGRLDLDADLSPLIPEFADLQVLEGFDEDGTPRLRPARRAVTLRQLLTHTSGFGYAFMSQDLARWAAAGGGAEAANGSRASYKTPLVFEPGEGWAYGVGIDWAGLAVEAVSGQTLDAYFRDHILIPLGMTETTFVPSAAQVARRAAAHFRLPDGGLTPTPFEMPREPEVWSGGGGLYSTAHDYARFLRMLLNDGELDGVRILSSETMAELSRVQTGETRAGELKSSAAHLTNDFDLFPGMHTGWGLATLINPEPGPAGRSAGSLAWAGLFNTHFWADPDKGVGGLLLTQVAPFGDAAVIDLFTALEAQAYGGAS
jgi:CubicO group peptidase (beta-lactamase class C family)